MRKILKQVDRLPEKKFRKLIRDFLLKSKNWISKKIVLLLFKICPPFEAYYNNKFLDEEIVIISDCWENSLNSLTKEIHVKLKDTDLAKLESIAKEVQESALKRKERIEAKSASYFGTFSIIFSILATFPIVFSKDFNLPKIILIVTVFFYLLALLHLFGAISYSISVRKISKIAQLSMIDLQNWLNHETLDLKPYIALIIVNTKYNELVIQKKSNYLVVVEKLFTRSIFFVLTAIFISIICKLLL